MKMFFITCFMFFNVVCGVTPITPKNIADIIVKHPKQCKISTANWLPMPEGFNCGSRQCVFPNEMCSLSLDTVGSTISCSKLPDDCKALFTSSTQTPPFVPPTTTESIPEIVIVEHQTEPNLPSTLTTKRSSFVIQKTPIQNCTDANILCCYWASIGECDKNPTFMRLNCQQTCGTCGCKIGTVNACVVNIQNGCGPAKPTS